MRSSSLLVGLLLVSPVVYAQRAPAASSAPAASAAPAASTHTAPTSSPSISTSSSSASSASHSASPSPPSSSSPASSSSSNSHSGGGGFTPSSSHSSSSSGMGGSSGGIGNSSGTSSRHERERDSSRDSSNAASHSSGPANNSSSRTVRDADSTLSHSPTPRDSSDASAKRDTSTQVRRDVDQDNIRRGQGAATRSQAGSGSEDRPEANGRRQAQCDKEPCAKPAPQLSQTDWRLGRCQEGPCEPCPEGTSPTKYGNCVANARPAAAPAAALCPDGMRWSGASCESQYATGRQQQPGASQCLYYFSESNRLSSNLRSARRHESDECQKNSGSAECSFARMDVVTAESACSILVAQAPAECKSQVSSCL